MRDHFADFPAHLAFARAERNTAAVESTICLSRGSSTYPQAASPKASTRIAENDSRIQPDCAASPSPASKSPNPETTAADFCKPFLTKPRQETTLSQNTAMNSSKASAVTRNVHASAAPAIPICFKRNQSRTPYKGSSIT